ncbi:hypothetical protein [Microbacterium sp. TPD7012]|uniref:hypothetical protein n=1 Tax=Microbacterium sp. TPD7012 TaxID=2171975 RepID=UPI0010574E6D|nr:hypothetical protein [Microbacterium sp. TPD7012]
MKKNGRWSLFGGLLFFGIGVYMVIRGVGPEVHSYVAAVLVFVAAAAWITRFIVDVREAEKASKAEKASESETAREP